MAFRWQRWPTHFKTIWQKFGADGREWGIDYTKFGQKHHCGVDIKSGSFGEVMAVAGGTVVDVDYGRSGLGHNVTIKHNDRYDTVYAHLSRVFVEESMIVAPGSVIAWSGWTGNTKGNEQHLHIALVDRLMPDEGCYSKYTDPEPYYRHLLPVVVGGPKLYDIYSYMAGDGRSYRVRSNTGAQEAFRTEIRGSWAYQVKNAQWEEFRADDLYLYRRTDTSPGDGRYYQHLKLDGTPGAPWAKRHMAIGETFSSGKIVQFFHKNDCSKSPRNSGIVTDTIRLIAHQPVWSSDYGYVIKDVIRLLWMEGGEVYYYAKNYGLCGWSNATGSHRSAILEDTDERHEMEQIECIS